MPQDALLESGSAAIQQAQDAANSAARAFWSWSRSSPSERSELFDALAASLDRGRDALVDAAAQEIGAGSDWVDFNIHLAKAHLLQALDLIPLMDDVTVAHPDGRRSRLRRQAVGVVLGIAPWNAPITLAARAIAAPLACGNTVVLKTSDHSPKTQTLMVELFREAGLPEGVASVVTCAPEESYDVARALIRHEAVRRINFTGSTRVGQIIASEAAQVLKRCVLELSGKAPLIVLEDADLPHAVQAAAHGAFFNQGQICMSTERIILLDEIADRFVADLTEHARKLRAVDPLGGEGDLGRLIDENAARRVSELIEDAVSKGAHLLCGGDRSGAVMQPAVLDHVTPQMRIYSEESFGPVASIIRVRDDEEAVTVANDTQYGLAGAVMGTDLARCHAVAERLEAGICQINGPTVFDDPNMPFGGMKASGYGRVGGPFALDEFTDVRWISEHPI